MMKLTKGEVLKLQDVATQTVTAHAGSVWITEEASARDVMLRPGDRFMFTRPGLALLEAFSDDVLVSFDA